MNVPILNLNELFSEMSPSERWTIVEPLLARDGPPGNVMTIGKALESQYGYVFFGNIIKKYTRFFFRKV